MPLPSWPHLLVLMALVLTLCIFAIFAAGHFPYTSRSPELKTPAATATIWGTIIIAASSALLSLAFAFRTLPWYAAVIGSGLMVLAAPLIAQMFPDRFVNSKAVLLILSATMLLLLLFGYSL